MANGPQPGPSGALREAAVRGLAILASLLLGGGVILARLFSHAPATLATWVVFCLALYLALTAFLWGLNGFAFRRLPLSGAPLSYSPTWWAPSRVRSWPTWRSGPSRAFTSRTPSSCSSRS